MKPSVPLRVGVVTTVSATAKNLKSKQLNQNQTLLVNSTSTQNGSDKGPNWGIDNNPALGYISKVINQEGAAMFEVREKGTDRLIGTYSTRSRANNKRDKLDCAYGCYHYYVVNLALQAELAGLAKLG